MAIYRPPTLLQCLTRLILNTGYCMYCFSSQTDIYTQLVKERLLRKATPINQSIDWSISRKLFPLLINHSSDFKVIRMKMPNVLQLESGSSFLM